MINGILFDIDGTLTSINPRYVEPVHQAVISQMGYVPMDQLDNILRDLFSSLGKKSKYIITKSFWNIGRSLGMNIWDALRFMLETKKNYELSKHRFEFLDGAQESIELALELGQVGLVTSALKEDVEQAIMKYPLLGEVDVIITWDDVDHPKPNPEPLLLACKALGLPPGEVMFIGDLPTDILAARSCGAFSTAFLGEFGEYTSCLLEEQEPNYIVADHNELQKVIFNTLTSLPVPTVL